MQYKAVSSVVISNANDKNVYGTEYTWLANGHTLCSELLASNFLMAFCSKQEYRHMRGVHYVEYTCIFNYEAPTRVTSDGFNFVRIKQRFVWYVIIYS